MMDVRRKTYRLLGGVTLAALVLVPNLEYANVRLVYAAVVLLMCGALLRTRLSDREKLQCVVWLMPSVYLILHGLIAGADWSLLLQYFARNTFGVFGMALAMLIVRHRTDLVWLTLGMLPFMLVDALLSVGQGVGVTEAFIPSLLIHGEDGLTTGWSDSTPIRGWGLTNAAHVSAYVQGLWGCACLGIVLVTRRGIRAIFAVSFVATCIAVTVSAQRTAFWLLVGGTVLLLLTARRKVGMAGLVVLGTAIVVIGTVLEIGAETTFRLWEWSQDTADIGRFASLKAGLNALAQDFLFGTAVDQYSESLAVHNGILSGWLNAGLPWVILVVVALFVTFKNLIMGAESRLGCAVATTLLVGILLNAMFHTLMPGRNDITGLVMIGLALAYGRNLNRGPVANSDRPFGWKTRRIVTA